MSKHNDQCNYFPATTPDPIGKYVQPRPYKDEMGENGYPNNVANTQTVRTRGTKLATKGRNSSTKLG